MGETIYPDFRDLYSFLSDVISDSRRDWSRHLTWVGSALTAIAILLWLALDLLQGTPALLNPNAILILALMIYIAIRYADSMLPSGISGLLGEASGSEQTSQSPGIVASYLKANLAVERERAFWLTFGDWAANLPLLLVFVEAGFSSPPVGVLAGLITVMRIVVSSAWLLVVLAVLNPRMLDAYVSSSVLTQEMIGRSSRAALFLFKLRRVGRLVGVLLSTAFYGMQLVAISLLYLYYVGPDWPAIRLLVISFGVGLLSLFAYHAWDTAGTLADASAGVERVRNRMVFGQYQTTGQATSALADLTRASVRERLHPSEIPDDVMEAITGFHSGSDSPAALSRRMGD